MKHVVAFVKGLLLVILLALTFIYAVTFNSQLGWMMLLFVIFFFLLTILSMCGSLKNIMIKPIKSINTQVNEKTKILIDLKNIKNKRVFFPVLIIRNKELDLDYRLVLFFKSKQSFSIEWIAKERLFLDSLKFEVISTDFFGVFKKSKIIEVPTNIYVLPLSQVNGNSVLELLNREMKQAMFGDSSFDLEKIRLYQSGDPVKQIDWKLSSKKQELIFREYEMHQTADTLFLFYGVRSFYYEKMLSLFFSLYQTVEGKKYSFLLMGDNINQEKKLDILDFAKIKKSDNPGEIPMIKEELLVIFTPEMTGRLTKALARIDPKKKIQVLVFKEIEGRLLI